MPPPQPPSLGQSIPILFRPRPEPIPQVIRRPPIVLYPVPANTPGAISPQAVAKLPGSTAVSGAVGASIGLPGVRAGVSFSGGLEIPGASAISNAVRRFALDDSSAEQRQRDEEEWQAQKRFNDEQEESSRIAMAMAALRRRFGPFAATFGNPIDVAKGLLNGITSNRGEAVAGARLPMITPLNPLDIIKSRAPRGLPGLLSPQDIINRISDGKKFVLSPESIAATDPAMAIARRQAINNAIASSSTINTKISNSQNVINFPPFPRPFYYDQPSFMPPRLPNYPPAQYDSEPPKPIEPSYDTGSYEDVSNESIQPDPTMYYDEENNNPTGGIMGGGLINGMAGAGIIGGLASAAGSTLHRLGEGIEGLGGALAAKDGKYPLFGIREKVGAEIGLGPLGDAEASIGKGINLSPLLSPMLNAAGGLFKGVGATAMGLGRRSSPGVYKSAVPLVAPTVNFPFLRRSGVKHEQSAIEQYGIGNQNLMGNVQQINWDKKKGKKRRGFVPAYYEY